MSRYAPWPLPIRDVAWWLTHRWWFAKLWIDLTPPAAPTANNVDMHTTDGVHWVIRNPLPRGFLHRLWTAPLNFPVMGMAAYDASAGAGRRVGTAGAVVLQW